MKKFINAFIRPDRFVIVGIAIVFTIGVVLRSIHFFARSSMWLDELASSFNVMERSYYQLATETLDFNQVAPIGFLLLQKLASLSFGLNDHAFRFFPFIFSLLALLLMYYVCKFFLKGITAFGAFTLFALSIAILFYSAEAKQYSADVTASLFIVWSTLQLIKGPIKKVTLWIIAGGGFFLILCSMPAVVIAPLALLPVFIGILKKKINLTIKEFAVVAIFWAISCLLLSVYAQFIISNDVQQAMSDYWSGGFAPLTGFVDFLIWIPLSIHKELSFLLSWYYSGLLPQTVYIAWALIFLSIPGLIYGFKKNKIAISVLFTPLLTSLILALFQVLPFDGRVSLYSTWPILISGMMGIIALTGLLPKKFSPIVRIPLTLVLCLPLGLAVIATPHMRPPYNGQSVQPVLRELKQQIQPGDVIYGYFKTGYALRFYGPKEGVTDYMIGHNHQTIEPLLRDIDSLKGKKRVWFIFTQWTVKQPFPDSIKAYMGGVIGKEIYVIPDPDGNTDDLEAAAHLYDLSVKTSNLNSKEP